MPPRLRRAARPVALAALLAVSVAGCSGGTGAHTAGPTDPPATSAAGPTPAAASHGPDAGPFTDPPTDPPPSPAAPSQLATLPGMPPLLDPHNVYAADTAGNLAPAVKGALSRVYVPNGISGTVSVIDPVTYKVVKTLKVGKLPQHVVPSWDLKTLWVTDDLSNDLKAIDPRTATITRTVPVDDPYNLYFTPDGKAAMVMAEARRRIDFRNPQTMALETPLSVGCKGVDHGDFTADGRFFVASCEFAGEMVVVDVAKRKVDGYIQLGSSRYAPQDVKLSPDGNTFYVADMKANGVWRINAHSFKLTGLLPTGKGAHGLYVSRDFKTMYVTNRDEGSVGLIDLANGTLADTWQIGNAASPDMGNLNAAGTVLWLSGRYNADVYAIDTSTGRLIAKINTGVGPHGVCVWPQPGRYSLGHTGILR
jgi:YVTN family beta-propeller protein